MFRNRTSTRKPSDQLYANFKRAYPEVGPGTIQATLTSPMSDDYSSFLPGSVFKNDPMVSAKDVEHDEWRLTPSLLDHHLYQFPSGPIHPQSYYTPTPGGTSTMYHNLAGDLHTPNLGAGLMTPISLGASESSAHPPLHPQPYDHSQSFHPQDFHHRPYDPTGLYQMGQYSDQTLHLAPYDTLIGQSKPEHLVSGIGMVETSPVLPLSAQFDAAYSAIPSRPNEDFRFLATLNAPTAMVRHADEIPISYLNKGQAYTLTIHDTALSQSGATKYRTFIRVSFEDEQQRNSPAACWQLWKEGRGSSEAHQRGGRLLAVEHVQSSQCGAELSLPQAHLVYTSFDGFAVEWSPSNLLRAECTISVRFNFLSTDFSHSKGVKGIPVRLCAKTRTLDGDAPICAETSYCKVKLFRDHGAERKLANDVAHVKKSIDKLKHQISQVESGIKDSGKRKRKSAALGDDINRRPAKVTKHTRSWSISDTSDTSGPKISVEDDLQAKLLNVQNMFSSTRNVSILSLRGEEGDDPDQHPVTLPAGDKVEFSKPPLIREPTTTSSTDRRSSVPDAFTSSRASSSLAPSLTPATSLSQAESGSHLQLTPPAWQTSMGPPKHARECESSPSGKVLNVPTVSNGLLAPSDHIKVVDIDSNYTPPLPRSNKPVACFYVLPFTVQAAKPDSLYRAVYLSERSLTNFIHVVSQKCKGKPLPVTRVIRHTPTGIDVVVDDEVIGEIEEGQDMKVRIDIISRHDAIKVEEPRETDVDAELEHEAIDQEPAEYVMTLEF